jgi:hypothetical protein
LEEVCGQICEEQLDGWYRVPSLWTSQRDLDNFDHWFEWSFHSAVAISATIRLSKKRFDCCCGYLAARWVSGMQPIQEWLARSHDDCGSIEADHSASTGCLP